MSALINFGSSLIFMSAAHKITVYAYRRIECGNVTVCLTGKAMAGEYGCLLNDSSISFNSNRGLFNERRRSDEGWIVRAL